MQRPQRKLLAGVQTHIGPLLLFAFLAIVWTWPLVVHLREAIPGGPGDNYSFLWNLWWMRRALADKDLSFFWTNYLFFPFGTSLTDHPHTALAALVAATVLKAFSLPTAQNTLLLASVFGNMAAMYALTWDVTHHRRAAVFGAMVFGISPYLAAHLMGHFDLMAAWVLPAYALALRRALAHSSLAAACAAGLVLATTAYTAYYYVVYLGLFTITFLAASTYALSVDITRRTDARMLVLLRLVAGAAFALTGMVTLWILLAGGGTFRIASVPITARTPQNTLTAMWVLAIFWVCLRWRARARLTWATSLSRHAVVRTCCVIAAMFVVLAFPLLWQALQLIRHGQYVSQTYQWRSAPRGIDLLAPLLGHPFHPMTGRLTSAAFTVMHLDRIEGVAWIGMVPLVVLLMGTNRPTGGHAEARLWWAVVCVFALWSAGPYLTIAGFDTGLRLPEILMRFVPFVSNARVPGRAMVVVYLALGVLTAIRLAGAPGRLSRPALQWTFVVLLAFEFLDAPILLTMLDRPPVYARLAEAEMGAVCEAPFGIGDGLGGVGSQDRATLYYATIHQHPLVGGYIGRMPPNSLEWYARSAVVSVLLRLSVDQRTPLPAIAGSMSSPCRYIVLNRGTASAALAQFVRSLPGELLVATPDRELYRLRDGGGAARHTFDR